MDAFKRLRCEFPGIKNVISEYTQRGTVISFLAGIEKNLFSGDGEELLYYLRELCAWYQKTIPSIHNNQFVYNPDEHDRNVLILNELFLELKEYDFSKVTSVMNNVIREGEPLIFLSHRSTDKKYGDALEQLITGIGVKNEQLIYSSHPLHKIPLDKNIYDYLREAFNRRIFVIILWSNEYLESPACLNEMGAAWVTQSDYTNIYLPSFDFTNPKYYQCAVDKNKMGAVLDGSGNCKSRMIELKNKIANLFALDVEENNWLLLLIGLLKTFVKKKTRKILVLNLDLKIKKYFLYNALLKCSISPNLNTIQCKMIKVTPNSGLF